MLGARVDTHERGRYEAQDRTDVDDQARPLTAHSGEHGLHHAQNADDVGLEQRLRLGYARFLDGTDQIDAGIVDQYVDPAGTATHLLDTGFNRSLISDVKRHDLNTHERTCRRG